MPIMRWAPNQDQNVYVMVGPSGGRPDFEQVPRISSTIFAPPGQDVTPPAGIVHLVGDLVFYPHVARMALLSAIGRWIAHWVVFRGGWTVYIDAPDRDPIKIRCAGRAEARVRADQLAVEMETHGVEAVDRLAR
ncbi:hypothetical protein [Catellatospora sp. NPDC049133]|uniref:hypothetical protein n=1 Tax=Catellatospora sp. NPDC049133 TaxID=3155499 RepID=UPI0034072EE8